MHVNVFRGLRIPPGAAGEEHTAFWTVSTPSGLQEFPCLIGLPQGVFTAMDVGRVIGDVEHNLPRLAFVIGGAIVMIGFASFW